VGRRGDLTRALDVRWRSVSNLHVEIGGRKAQPIIAGRQQYIAEDRNGVASLHHALNVGQGLEQRSTFDRQLHVFVRCSPPRFGPPMRRVRKGCDTRARSEKVESLLRSG